MSIKLMCLKKHVLTQDPGTRQNLKVRYKYRVHLKAFTISVSFHIILIKFPQSEPELWGPAIISCFTQLIILGKHPHLLN